MKRDYLRYDAIGLSELVDSGQVSPWELRKAADDIAKDLNPAINAVAFLSPLESGGCNEFDYAQPSPFKGVPFLTKDLITEVKGFPLYCGSYVTGDYISEEDSLLVARYRQCGLNLIGTTHSAELGLMPVTESLRFGPVRNPWDLSRNAGGSSGGAAAAVAAGIVPMAGATDGGGSVRIPAAFTGTFGFKPSRGLIPQDPICEPWDGAAVSHVITRSVRDSELVLRKTAGLTSSSSYACVDATALDAFRKDKPYKVLCLTESPLGGRVCKENLQALNEIAVLLEDLGCIVDTTTHIWDGHTLLDSFCPILFGQVAADLERIAKRTGSKLQRKKLEPATWLLSEIGKHVSAYEFARSKNEWNHFRKLMADVFEQYDFILSPVTAISAPENFELSPKREELAALKIVNSLGLHRALSRSNYFKESFCKSFEPFPFTLIANVTGIPAASVPVWLEGESLPSAVQLMAGIGRDISLMRLAGDLELARPWFSQYAKLNLPGMDF